MTNKPIKKSTHPSYTIYQITVQGALKENWRNWFNGILIATEIDCQRKASTILTCKVRDQAELIGILNWLHNMNLAIEKVNLFTSEMEVEHAN